jgi:hypothetical protein
MKLMKFWGLFVLKKYTVCEKSDVPDSVLQKEKIKFDGQELYFCIIEIVALG